MILFYCRARNGWSLLSQFLQGQSCWDMDSLDITRDNVSLAISTVATRLIFRLS